MSRYGEAIYERRDFLGITGPDLAAMSVDLMRQDPALYAKFSQQTLSRWESDKTGAIIAASSPARIRALAKLLDWSVEQFEHHVGVPGNTSLVTAMPEGQVQLYGELVMVPVVGVANGGRPGEYGIPVEPKMIRGGNTRSFKVEGNSMDTGKDTDIKDSDWVLVDVSLNQPVNGRVFLLEIIGDGFTVKRLRQVDGEWRFMSDNPESSESWRPDQVAIVGLVYGGVDYKDIH